MNKIYSTLNAVALAVTLLFFIASTASAYYDPGMQRWLNRDPLGDAGSMVIAVEKIEPRLESRSAIEIGMMVQQFEDSLSAFTQVNVNLSQFAANNSIGYIDSRGLDWLDCMANCVKSKDPLNNAGKVCLGFLGGTAPKSWFRMPNTKPPITTILSRLGLGGGTARAGTNIARIVGRVFSPVWVGYGLYLAGAEAACAGTCSGNPSAYPSNPVAY